MVLMRGKDRPTYSSKLFQRRSSANPYSYPYRIPYLCTEELKPQMPKHAKNTYPEYHHMKYLSNNPDCPRKSAETFPML